MANELLVTKELNREMIDAGSSLVAEMESQGFDATAILWLYFEEYETWRMVIASTDVDRLGRKSVYQRIRQILVGMKNDSRGLKLSDIAAVGETASPVLALRRRASKLGGVEEGRVSGSVAGEYIVDSYVYKVKPLEAGPKKG
jgi:hypothetical protein